MALYKAQAKTTFKFYIEIFPRFMGLILIQKHFYSVTVIQCDFIKLSLALIYINVSVTTQGQ